MGVYEGISAKLEIETDCYISLEAVEADKVKPECHRKYSIFEASVNFEKVKLVKFDGKNYLTKSTHFIVDGPIPYLHSGRS